MPENISHTGNGSCAELVIPESCKVFWLVCNAILLPSFCLLGLIGNTLSILVLHRDKGNRVASFLLRALAVADNCFLVVTGFAVGIVWGILPYPDSLQLLFEYLLTYADKYANPLSFMLLTCIAWFTVLLTVNRYIAICHPFYSLWLFTKGKAYILVGAVVFFSIAFNFPRFFTITIIHSNGRTCQARTVIGRRTMFDVVYTGWLHAILVLIIPFVSLLVLNFLVVRELRARNRTPRQDGGGGTADAGGSEYNISVTMLLVAAVFLICNAPEHVRHLLLLIFPYDTPLNSRLRGPCEEFLVVANLLAVINSCCNFVIYYLVRHSFRTNLMRMLTGRGGRKKPSSVAYSSSKGHTISTTA